MLENLKILLGITGSEKDKFLCLILDMAEKEAKDYCKTEDLSGLEPILLEMAIFKYNRIDTQGISSESYSGASYSYSDDYPANIKAALNRRRKARLI